MTLYNNMYYIIPLAVMLHFVTTRFVWTTGTTHYSDKGLLTQENNQGLIYDIVHNNTTDYSQYNYTKNWFMIFFLLPIFINFDKVSSAFLIELVIKFCLIVIIRSLTMASTILPRQNGCEVKNLGLFNMTIGGTCYDKMFSGHFALGFLITLMLFKYNIVRPTTNNLIYFFVINAVHALILTITRSHYSMDVVVAFFITFLVNDYANSFFKVF